MKILPIIVSVYLGLNSGDLIKAALNLTNQQAEGSKHGIFAALTLISAILDDKEDKEKKQKMDLRQRLIQLARKHQKQEKVELSENPTEEILGFDWEKLSIVPDKLGVFATELLDGLGNPIPTISSEAPNVQVKSIVALGGTSKQLLSDPHTISYVGKGEAIAVSGLRITSLEPGSWFTFTELDGKEYKGLLEHWDVGGAEP